VSELFIVDGYNVLYALFPSLAQGELASRRDWLASRLASYAALHDVDVVLIWDAHGSGRSSSQVLKGTRVEVCYAAGRLGADTAIARRIAEQPSDVSVVVVSADQEVQRTAARASVRRMTPRELGLDLENLRKELAQSSQSTRIPASLEDKVDLETWRRLERLRRPPK